MAFNMKGSSLYGKLNLNRGGQANRPDGRAKSSSFQKDATEYKGRIKEGAPMKTSPMTGKPKHQKGGSYTYNGKTYPDFAHLPDDAKRQIYAKNHGPKGKEIYGIKDEDRGEEVAKKPGAPAIWPFGKKTPGGAKLVKVKKTKTIKPSQDLEGESMQGYLDRTKGKRNRGQVVKNITKKVKDVFKKK